MVKNLPLKYFGVFVQFSKPDNHNKSQMVFMDDAETSPHKLVKKIRSLSNLIITCAKELQHCLKKYDFYLNDWLCDMQDLKQASGNIQCQYRCSSISLIWTIDHSTFDITAKKVLDIDEKTAVLEMSISKMKTSLVMRRRMKMMIMTKRSRSKGMIVKLKLEGQQDN